MKLSQLEACWFGVDSGKNAVGGHRLLPRDESQNTTVLGTVTPGEHLPLNSFPFLPPSFSSRQVLQFIGNRPREDSEFTWGLATTNKDCHMSHVSLVNWLCG